MLVLVLTMTDHNEYPKVLHVLIEDYAQSLWKYEFNQLLQEMKGRANYREFTLKFQWMVKWDFIPTDLSQYKAIQIQVETYQLSDHFRMFLERQEIEPDPLRSSKCLEVAMYNRVCSDLGLPSLCRLD